MELFTAISERRSVKHFDPEAKMPAEDFEKIIDAVRLSPSSYNIQHWRFLRVTDPAIREQLTAAAWGQHQVKDAAELVLICADMQAWSDRPERYWVDATAEVRDTLLPMLDGFYRGKPELQRDEAIRSSGLCAQTLMLAAKGLGYDSCPMIGFDPEQVAKIINLPDNYLVGMMIPMGKALKPANPRGGLLPLNDILFENSF